jgi:hypothetical protein
MAPVTIPPAANPSDTFWMNKSSLAVGCALGFLELVATLAELVTVMGDADGPNGIVESALLFGVTTKSIQLETETPAFLAKSLSN